MPDTEVRVRRDGFSTRPLEIAGTSRSTRKSTQVGTNPSDHPRDDEDEALRSLLKGSRHVPSTRKMTENDTVEVTYSGYWWGSPVRVITRQDPLTIRPLLGTAPPNGRATITCEYDKEGLYETTASYTINESGTESIRNLCESEPRVAVATTYGEGRVGARIGRSRPLLFMTNYRGVHYSTMSDRDLCEHEVGVYIEVLGDWKSRMSSTDAHAYDRDGKDNLG